MESPFDPLQGLVCQSDTVMQDANFLLGKVAMKFIINWLVDASLILPLHARYPLSRYRMSYA